MKERARPGTLVGLVIVPLITMPGLKMGIKGGVPGLLKKGPMKSGR